MQLKYIHDFYLLASLSINITNLIVSINIAKSEYQHTKISKTFTKK